MGSGERYVLIPREIIESDAYRALPDWAVRVLVALAAQYYGTHNGSLALPIGDASTLGVRQRWQVYAGLRLLESAELVTCTRRGHLVRGGKLASMYALTWRGIDMPREGIVYDPGIKPHAIPSHAWAQWKRPDDWDSIVRRTVDRARGTHNRARARVRVQHLTGKNPDAHSVGTDHPHG